MKDNLKIPYGLADFKRIRNEGYYYIDKTDYIPLLEPEIPNRGGRRAGDRRDLESLSASWLA